MYYVRSVCSFIVSWKLILLYWLFGPKNQAFRNKSGKTQPIRTKFGIHGHVKGDNVQVILGAIGPFLAKWGLGRIPRSPSFFCMVIQRTFRQLRNGWFSPHLVTKRIRKDIFETCHFRGHLPPKSEVENWSNCRHLRAGYRSWDALQRDTVYSTL